MSLTVEHLAKLLREIDAGRRIADEPLSYEKEAAWLLPRLGDAPDRDFLITVTQRLAGDLNELRATFPAPHDDAPLTPVERALARVEEVFAELERVACWPGHAEAASRARAPGALTLDDKFARLAALLPDWDSYNAPSIVPSVLTEARAWMEAVSVVPCSDGGVQLEWHRNDVDVEVQFNADATVEAFAEDAEDRAASSEPRAPGSRQGGETL